MMERCPSVSASPHASGEAHDRMPVILERDVWDERLHPEKILDATAMPPMIDADSQAIATTMRTHLVGRTVKRVSRPRVQPRCFMSWRWQHLLGGVRLGGGPR